MPCEPVFRGPFLPLAWPASSSRAFLSVKIESASMLSHVHSAYLFPLVLVLCFHLSAGTLSGGPTACEKKRCYEPACCLALKAISSSSSSLVAFLGFLLWMGFVPATKCTCQLQLRLRSGIIIQMALPRPASPRSLASCGGLRRKERRTSCS